MTTVIRPTWRPTKEQADLLAKAEAAARAADTAEEAAWQAIKRARDVGVPDTILCARTKRSRATLHRKFGRRAG